MGERRRRRAGPDEPAGASPAGSTWDQPRQRDRIPDLAIRDARPDRLDHPGALVAHDDRGRADPLAEPDVEVRVADAGGEELDPDLAGPWLVQLERLDRRRLADGRQDGGPDRHVAMYGT
jgi:hypothetical protein